MYASIQYRETATQEDAISDIVGVTTGTITDVTGLSASAVQLNSQITTTIPGGWTLWDDRIAEEGYAVLRAPISDIPSQFKYIKIEKYLTDRVIWSNYKTWDNTAHTGTHLPRWYNSTEYDTSNHIFYNYLSKVSLTMISSSANHFAGIDMFNNQATQGPMSIMTEHSRRSPWDTVENGYTPIVFNSVQITNLNQIAPFITPEFVGHDGTEYIYSNNPTGYKDKCKVNMTSSISETMSYSIYSAMSYRSAGGVEDENLEMVDYLLPLGVSNPTEGNFGGDISSKCNIYISNLSNGSMPYTVSNDIYQAGGQQYRIWEPYNGSCYFMVLEA